MGIYEEHFRIRYSEVDLNNEITPISIMQYFQEIGCLHSNYLGMGINPHAAWIIIQWKVKIFSKVNWNDEILIKTWPSGIQGPYCFRDYEMYKGEELIAIGTSKWVLTDIVEQKILRINDDIAKKFKPVDNHVFKSEFLKMKQNENYENLEKYIVSIKEIDTNQHVNNIKYIEIAEKFYNEKINYIEVMYKHAGRLGDELDCYYNNSEVAIMNGERLCAIVRFNKEEK